MSYMDWTDGNIYTMGDDPGEPTLLRVDRVIELLQRAKESGAEYIIVQFNQHDERRGYVTGINGLYAGSWHDANLDGCYILCFESTQGSQ